MNLYLIVLILKEINTVWKHLGTKFASPFTAIILLLNFGVDMVSLSWENGTTYLIATHKCGIVKAYEAVTQYCGWHAIEAGKTMGLSPYGGPNPYSSYS